MADAKKCDRCGMFYESTNYDERSYMPGGVGYFNILQLLDKRQNGDVITRRKYDLCPDCRLILSNWLTEVQGEETKK